MSLIINASLMQSIKCITIDFYFIHKGNKVDNYCLKERLAKLALFKLRG